MSSIPQRLYNEVMMADNFTCVYCGERTPDVTIDHFVPQSYGGPDVLHNLFACCWPCNSRKSDYAAHEVGMAPRFGRFATANEPIEPSLAALMRNVPRRRFGTIRKSERIRVADRWDSEEERVGRILDLAGARKDDGRFQFSANAIVKMVGGARTPILMLIRKVRSDESIAR